LRGAEAAEAGTFSLKRSAFTAVGLFQPVAISMLPNRLSLPS
jgi:hypothetical protein